MGCYYHNNQAVVAQCTDCGKNLCKKCSSLYEIPLCKECATNRNNNLKKEAFKNLGVFIIAIVVGAIIGISQHKSGGMLESILAGIILVLPVAGAPNGWRALNKITPNIFLFLPVIGWVIYYIVKGVLSMVVGLFLLPFKTVKGLIMYIKSLKNQKYINENFE